MNKEMGIRTAGLEKRFEEIIKEYLSSENECLYLEIGAAGCKTMRFVYDIIKKNIKTNNWLITGIDLLDGYSLDEKLTNKLFSEEELLIIKDEKLSDEILKTAMAGNYHAYLRLSNNPRNVISQLPNDFVNICFIDGEHSKQEVTKDFLAVEEKIRNGGLIVFHDTCVLSQGTDYQVVGQEFINVRAALRDLGLLDNKRPGWKFKEEILGTRFSGGDGNGCIWIEKL